jgi:hypothetical protein
MRLFTSIFALVWLTLGCETSPPAACEEASAAPSLTLDRAPATATGAAQVELSGSLISSARLSQLMIGGVRATGVGNNFRTWKVTIPASSLANAREGGSANLEVVAYTTCGTAFPLEDIPVSFDAPTGTPAPELSVELIANHDGTPECFIPANGAVSADIIVRASTSADGVPVKLTTSAAAEILGLSSTGEVTLRAAPASAPSNGGSGGSDTGNGQAGDGAGGTADEYANAHALLHGKSTSDAVVTVAATAGPNTQISQSLTLALPPRFNAPPSTIPNDKPAVISVSTAGRFEQCSAVATSPAEVSLFGAANDSLVLGPTPVPLDLPDCGQQLTITVEFPAGTAPGATVLLACSDVWKQTSRVSIASSGDAGDGGT